MLSSGFAGPLRLRRKLSKLLAGYLITLHVLAVFALLLPINLAVNFQLVLLLLLCVSAYYHVRYFRRQYDEDRYWIWNDSGYWQYGEDAQLYQLVLSKSVQTGWFATLTLGNAYQQRRLLIIRDQLDADTFRRLRVRLKLHHEDTAEESKASV